MTFSAERRARDSRLPEVSPAGVLSSGRVYFQGGTFRLARACPNLAACAQNQGICGLVSFVADGLVLGAGVIGCAVAEELTRRGAKVEVVDPRGVGLGARQAAAGVLSADTQGRPRTRPQRA